MRRASWIAVCLAICALGLTGMQARAEAEMSTIYLQNGGKLRGEIVVDMPGAPLTVMVAGQAMQVPRESISRIESAAAQAAPEGAAVPGGAGPAQAPVATAPVYVAPAPAAAPVPPPPPAGGAVMLQVDRRGRAAIDMTWSPELQQLVHRRNDVAHRMSRTGLGAPITLLSLSAVGFIATGVATALAAEAYSSCISDLGSNSFEVATCQDLEDSLAIGRGVGFGLSSALFAGGATFLTLRLIKKKTLKRQLGLIDQDLRRFNVAPMARLNTTGGGMAGLSLRAAF